MSVLRPSHAEIGEPSAWVKRFAHIIRPRGAILDVASGRGRHARWLAGQGFSVEAVDRDREALDAFADTPGVCVRAADLEDGRWPYEGRLFDAVVVTNYLFRSTFLQLLGCVAPGGVLIYETFMLGNERFGKPSNPDFLLAAGELLQWLGDQFDVIAFEQGEVEVPKPAMIQRVCAIRKDGKPRVLPRIG